MQSLSAVHWPFSAQLTALNRGTHPTPSMTTDLLLIALPAGMSLRCSEWLPQPLPFHVDLPSSSFPLPSVDCRHFCEFPWHPTQSSLSSPSHLHFFSDCFYLPSYDSSVPKNGMSSVHLMICSNTTCLLDSLLHKCFMMLIRLYCAPHSTTDSDASGVRWFLNVCIAKEFPKCVQCIWTPPLIEQTFAFLLWKPRCYMPILLC